MLNRTTLTASSIIALIVAAFIAQPGHAEGAAKAAANECLSKPGAAGPRGTHWFYRIDRPTGRRCWYLGSEDTRVRRAVPEPKAAVTRPAPEPDELLPAERTPAETSVPATAQTRAADANSVAAAKFSAEWPTASAAADSSDRDSAPATGNDDADQTAVADAQAEMPLVWPAPAPDAAAAGQRSEPAPPGIGHLLLFLAAIMAFVAIGIRAVLKLSAAWRTHREPRLEVQPAEPIIRQRAPQRRAFDHIATTADREGSALRPLHAATRWDTISRLPHAPNVPLYEDTEPDEDDARAPWRRRRVA